MKFHTPGYDTEAVRQMVETARAEATTLDDIYNISRPGATLGKAQIRPGFFDRRKVNAVVRGMLRRRLLAQLGRSSPRLPGPEYDTTCQTCGGEAVKFEGRWLCENGHGGVTNE